jgi:hypothetical protein
VEFGDLPGLALHILPRYVYSSNFNSLVFTGHNFDQPIDFSVAFLSFEGLVSDSIFLPGILLLHA